MNGSTHCDVVCRSTVSLLVRYNSNDTSLYTDLADPGLSQLLDSWLGGIIVGVGFCSNITIIQKRKKSFWPWVDLNLKPPGVGSKPSNDDGGLSAA